MSKLNDNAQTDQFLDLPKELRGPAATHGREMVALVYGAGMASEATQRIAHDLAVFRCTKGTHGLLVLSTEFNQVATALAKAKGWTEGELAMCDRDINISFANTVQETPCVILTQ